MLYSSSGPYFSSVRWTEVGLDGWCGMALGNRGVTLEMVHGNGASGEPWCMHGWIVSLGHLFSSLCALKPPSHALVVIKRDIWFNLERGGMPLHDAVGVNLRGCNYWISWCRCQAYGLNHVCWMIVCLSDLTWLSLLGGGRKTWYIIDIISQVNVLEMKCLRSWLECHERIELGMRRCIGELP